MNAQERAIEFCDDWDLTTEPCNDLINVLEATERDTRAQAFKEAAMIVCEYCHKGIPIAENREARDENGKHWVNIAGNKVSDGERGRFVKCDAVDIRKLAAQTKRANQSLDNLSERKTT